MTAGHSEFIEFKICLESFGTLNHYSTGLSIFSAVHRIRNTLFVYHFYLFRGVALFVFDVTIIVDMNASGKVRYETRSSFLSCQRFLSSIVRRLTISGDAIRVEFSQSV